MLVEEGTYISNHKGELLNSKNEWHQAKIIRTTTRVLQGGADLLRQQQGGGGRDGRDQRQPQGRSTRTWGQWWHFLKSSTSVVYFILVQKSVWCQDQAVLSVEVTRAKAETVFPINSLISRPLTHGQNPYQTGLRMHVRLPKGLTYRHSLVSLLITITISRFSRP